MWLVELAILLLPVSLIAETNPEESRVNPEILMHAYEGQAPTTHGGHAPASVNSSAHPVTTGASTSNKVEGTFEAAVDEGCRIVRADDGKRYSFTIPKEGITDIKNGEHVELTFSSSDLRSPCMEGVAVSGVVLKKTDKP